MEDEPAAKPEGLRSKVAGAIYDSQVKMARERAAAYEMDFDRLRRVFTTARDESDRSAAILVFALIEDLMSECLQRNLNPNVRGGWGAVVDNGGLLATASDRLVLLQLLYWIRDQTHDDLRLLKSIRNHFAHHADVVSFDDPKVAGWISGLSSVEVRVDQLFLDNGVEVSAWRKFSRRELYMMRAASAVAHLLTDLAISPSAIVHHVHPGHVESGYDEAPDNLKEARRFAADVILWFFPTDDEPDRLVAKP